MATFFLFVIPITLGIQYPLNCLDSRSWAGMTVEIFYFINNPTISNATILATLIIGLIAGPAVSL